MTDVFISYARQELALAEPIKHRLEALGLKVFFDVDGGIDAGDAFPVRIGDAVSNAKAVLALWTPHALTREWCRRECHLAQQLGKLVATAMLPVTVADLKEFVATSYEDISTLSDDAQHFGWSQVLSAIARKMDAWAENNAADPGAPVAIEQASLVRKAAIACRPQLSRAETSGLTGVEAVWDRLKSSNDADDILRFAESFPGTVHAFEARRLVDKLKRERLTWASVNQASSVAIGEYLAANPSHHLEVEIRRVLQEAHVIEEKARAADEEIRRKNEKMEADAREKMAIEILERQRREEDERIRAIESERMRIARIKQETKLSLQLALVVTVPVLIVLLLFWIVTNFLI